MGLRDIDNADVTSNAGSRNPYFQPGQYIVEIRNIRFFRTRKGTDAALVMLNPLESDNEIVKPGVVHSWYCGFDNELGPLNFKRFLAAAYGLDPMDPEANARITYEVAEAACGTTQPLTGQPVGLTCHITKTQAQTDFTVHTWHPIGDQEYADLQARLAR
jgi:hypothetical protein